ncbi:MAG TPA: Hsp70 family protein [Pseudonocardiaceae bacterium]|nr:Hsp70 family protein [Pseudonocardiaceae bacterium]
MVVSSGSTQHKTVLIFELGAVDVSVLDVGDGVVEVQAVADLDGDDFDQRLIDHLADDFQRGDGINLRADPQAPQRVSGDDHACDVDHLTSPSGGRCRGRSSNRAVRRPGVGPTRRSR